MSENQLLVFRNTPTFCKELQKKLLRLDKNRKNLLFIEPYGAVISLVKRAIQVGHQVIVLTANSGLRKLSQPLIDVVQLAIQIDTVNEEKLRDLGQILLKFSRIDGVVPGFEYFVPYAARLGQDLGLPGMSIHEVENFRSKLLMRRALQKAGLAVPKFHICYSIEDLPTAWEKISFPAICKPVDAAGSVYVKKVHNSEEAFAAAKTILQGNTCLWGHRLAKAMLIEEYIDGKEYSAEGLVQDGKIHYYSITEKFVADQLEFVEVGHIANVPLNKNLQASIEAYLNQVLSVLQANHCPFHAEFRIDRTGRPILMEVAARLPGDRIADLVCLSREVNYLDAVMACYLGEKVSLDEMRNNYAGIRFFYRPELPAYSSIQGLDKLDERQVVELAFYYSSQEPIPAFPKPLRRLGHIILKGPHYEDLCQALTAIDKSLVFKA